MIRETVHESVARACKEQQRQIEVFLKKRVLVYLAIGFPSGQDSFTTEKCLAQFILSDLQLGTLGQLFLKLQHRDV